MPLPSLVYESNLEQLFYLPEQDVVYIAWATLKMLYTLKVSFGWVHISSE